MGSGHNKYCDMKNCEQKWRREDFCYVSSFFFIIKRQQDVRQVPASIFQPLSFQSADRPMEIFQKIKNSLGVFYFSI